MPIFGQFELLEPIRIAAVETWLAREHDSERPLLLHKFSCDSGLRERLLTMRPQDLIMLMRAGEENGVCFVVTYDTPELRDFSHWIDERATQSAKPATAPTATAASSPEPGEFTRMFETPAPASRPSQPQRPTPAEPSLEPGDFTRAFETLSIAPPQPQRPAPAQASSEPGEFTRMFQSPVSTPSSSQPQSPSPIKATNEPGDFTKFFSNRLPDSTLPQDLRKPAEDRPLQEPPREPGEFTRHFGQESFKANVPEPAGAPVPPPVLPLQRPPDGSATGVFSAPQPAHSVPASSASGPGEYTRMFDRPPRPPEPPARPSAPAPELMTSSSTPAPPQRNYTPLVIILSLLVIAALALVVYFILHR